MKARDAVIAWNPGQGSPMARDYWRHQPRIVGPGAMRVLRYDEHDHRAIYPKEVELGGPSFSARSDIALHRVMLAWFHTLVIREGIPVEDAHREFLKIDEYRRCSPRDTQKCPGHEHSKELYPCWRNRVAPVPGRTNSGEKDSRV